MALVIDCSVAMTWCLRDEATPETDALLDRAVEETFVVPSHWHLEVANTLSQARKRNRLTEEAVGSFIRDLASLPIEVDESTWKQALGDTMEIARTCDLTIYDAAYIELASRRGLVIATLDGAMLRAAASRSLGVYPLRAP
ncbi:MAG TPA: type II toxin-antitoxin system VapC family toxin [Phycisphaerales bacterium]|nr:type II toxin-antitoxin system VapC family toxin [Phycisphaerales bacterium]